MHASLLIVATAVLGVDVGWRQLDGGGFEYIIQIEPEMVDSLRAGKELFSDIPPQLRDVRNYRIRIGREALPHDPIPEPAPRTPRPPSPGAADPSAVDPRATETRPMETRPAEPRPTATDSTEAEPTTQPTGTQPGGTQPNGTPSTTSGALTFPPDVDLTQPETSGSVPTESHMTGPGIPSPGVTATEPSGSGPSETVTTETDLGDPRLPIPASPPSGADPRQDASRNTPSHDTTHDAPGTQPAGPGTGWSPGGTSRRGDGVSREGFRSYGADTADDPSMNAATDPDGQPYGSAYRNPGTRGSNEKRFPGMSYPPGQAGQPSGVGHDPRAGSTGEAVSVYKETSPNQFAGDDSLAVADELTDLELGALTDAELEQALDQGAWPLTVTLVALGLFISLGVNVYMGWVTWGLRSRYRSLLELMTVRKYSTSQLAE